MARGGKQKKQVSELDICDDELLEKATIALLSVVEEESRETRKGDDESVEPAQRLYFDSFLELFILKEGGGSSKALRCGISTTDQRAILLSAIESFQRGHASRFFNGLRAVLEETINSESHIPEFAKMNAEFEEEDVVADETSTSALQFLRISALCTRTYLEAVSSKKKGAEAPPEKQIEVLDEAFETALVLHQILLNLTLCGPEGKSAQLSILKLCEAWWNANAKYREHLISQMLPLMIQSALSDTSPKSELIRLYHMRRAISYIDFADESSDWLRSVLMRVASSPRCLKVPEGRRFISYLFHADVLLIPSLIQAMRAQIPDAKTAVHEAYAEILFRAWKDAPEDEEDSFRWQIETNALSDLAYSMILVSKPSMFRALMKIFRQFFDNKRIPQVEDLLDRLYGPILWRSLTAANAKVRVNATYVLGELFPLDQSAHTQTAKQMEKACTALKNLLHDQDSQVRVAASDAVSRVLSHYWDALSTEDIRSFLEGIVTEHASDASSPAVRAAALHAIAHLLQAPQSHAVLRPLLPKLGNLINDKMDIVRLSAVRLLQRVKEIRGIKYYHVVSIPNLIARLALEKPRSPVASALTALMMNSYVPQGTGIQPVDQIGRTLKFLKNDPDAAEVFYATMSAHCPVNVVTKLAAWLFKCLYQAVATHESAKSLAEISMNSGKTTQVKRKRRRSPSREKQGEGNEICNSQDISGTGDSISTKTASPLSISQPALMARVAETICLLWRSIEKSLRLEANKEWRQYLVDSFSGSKLTEIVKYADSAAAESGDRSTQEHYYRIRSAVLLCAVMLPMGSVDGLHSYIQSVFRSVHDIPEDPVHALSVPGYIALFCNWNMEHEVATMLATSVAGFLDRTNFSLFDLPLSEEGNRRRGKGARRAFSNELIPQLPAQLALEVMGVILHDKSPMFVQARTLLLGSQDTRATLLDAFSKGLVYCSQLFMDGSHTSHDISDTNIEFALRCCELYGKFLLQTYSLPEQLDTSDGGHISTVLKFVSSVLTPSMISPDDQNASLFLDADISGICLPSPHSPMSDGPIRRRTRTRTPTKGDSIIRSTLRDDVEGAEVVGRLSESLLLWACSFMVDWISLTSAGTAIFVKEVARWCSVFDSEKKDSFSISLVRSFLKIALVASQKDHFEPLKSLLVAFNDKGEAVGLIFQESISTLVLHRKSFRVNSLYPFAQCLSDAIQLAGSKFDLAPDAELPSSAEDFWPEGSIKATLMVLMDMKEWRMEMIRLSLNAIKHQRSEEIDDVAERLALVNLRLIWILYARDSSTDAKHLIHNSEIIISLLASSEENANSRKLASRLNAALADE